MLQLGNRIPRKAGRPARTQSVGRSKHCLWSIPITRGDIRGNANSRGPTTVQVRPPSCRHGEGGQSTGPRTAPLDSSPRRSFLCGYHSLPQARALNPSLSPIAGGNSQRHVCSAGQQHSAAIDRRPTQCAAGLVQPHTGLLRDNSWPSNVARSNHSTQQQVRPLWERCGNDPSAGSPTETLLRLHLPLNDKV